MTDAIETERSKPENYGVWWNTNRLDESWYQEIYSVRVRAHEFFLNWFGNLIRQGQSITSVLEVGCGRGKPYATILSGHGYRGTDISEKEIAYCQQNHGGEGERFFVSDAIKDNLKGKYDVVFAHAVIDHVYDINAFIQALAKASKGWVYISAYRGWHPRLESHIYKWEESVTCFNNFVSPPETRRTLEANGCEEIQIFPIFVGNVADSIPLETVVIAKAPNG